MYIYNAAPETVEDGPAHSATMSNDDTCQATGHRERGPMTMRRFEPDADASEPKRSSQGASPHTHVRTHQETPRIDVWVCTDHSRPCTSLAN